MKRLLIILFILLSCSVAYSGASDNYQDDYRVGLLAERGAICRKFGHNWEPETVVEGKTIPTVRIIDARKCKICNKVQIRSPDWRDYEGAK